MNRSFAQFARTARALRCPLPRWLLPITGACALAACASLPPPTGELAEAQQAVSRANDADADQYAADAIARARDELSQAQQAMAKGRDSDARAAALAATTDAQYASAASDAAKARADYTQQRNDLLDLGQRLQLQADAPEQGPLDIAPAVPPAPVPGKADDLAAAPAARLQALEGNSQLNGFAAYERLRAHQALDALAQARGRDREPLARIADRRVDIAELAARTQATRQAIDRMQRQHSQWLVEASRQEAERARQEAEQLRVQAQVQAEEAQRLREQADSEAAARQQAEEVIDTVGADEAAKLKAARDKQAALAKQEADLIARSQAGSAKPHAATTAKSTKSGKPKASKPSAKKKKKIN